MIVASIDLNIIHKIDAIYKMKFSFFVDNNN